MSACKIITHTAVVEAGPGGLGIHSGPSPDAPVSQIVPDGEILNVLHQFGGWFAVRYNNEEGFVSGDRIVLRYA